MGLLIKNTIDEDLAVWKPQMDENFQVMDTALGYTQELNWKNIWTVSTLYKVGDIIRDPLSIWTYRCLVEHTSGTGTWKADRIANPTYWQARSINPQDFQTRDLVGEYINNPEDVENGTGDEDNFLTVLDLFEPGYNYRLQVNTILKHQDLGGQNAVTTYVALGAGGVFDKNALLFGNEYADTGSFRIANILEESDAEVVAEVNRGAGYGTFASAPRQQIVYDVWNAAEAGPTIMFFDAPDTRILTTYGTWTRGVVGYNSSVGALTDFHTYHIKQSTGLQVTSPFYAQLLAWRYKV